LILKNKKRYNLVIYGSLLHPDELKKHHIDIKKIKTVKVKGYKRVFNQLPSWRKSKGIKKAVMNIIEDENSWFNALVIMDLGEDYIQDLDIREIGYDRVNLANGNVMKYNGKVIKNCIIYKGKTEKQSYEILPNPDYFDICRDGALCYGEKFFNDYLKTTYKNDLKGNIVVIQE
jgi:hypothetical protein